MTALSPAARLLFRELVCCANKGERCPTNTALAAKMGIASASGVQQIFVKLVEAGVIKVHRLANVRIVTITESGNRTGSEKVGPTIAKARGAPPRNLDPATVPDPVDRDPCWKCGTRGDLPCPHRRSRHG